MSPEAAARQKIDEFLVAAGWAVQDYKAFNPGAPTAPRSAKSHSANGPRAGAACANSTDCHAASVPVGRAIARGNSTSLPPPDIGRKFTEIYNVQHLTSNTLDTLARVTFCTIHRLYSILRGEPEFDEDLDEKSAAELSAVDSRPKDVAYNAAVPFEAFDFIVNDECHRSIYGLWRQVIEYFDSHRHARQADRRVVQPKLRDGATVVAVKPTSF